MAMIKVFDVKGAKEIHCFDTLSNVPYMEKVKEVDGLLPDFEVEEIE